MARVLTVAGSDSGGGAGLQADLKTMAAFGVYGTSCVTAVTAQNTAGVQGIFEVPAEFVRLQLASVLGDIGCDAVKTGMLTNARTVEAVAGMAGEYRVRNLVVDPVLAAKDGRTLLEMDAVETLRQRLFPLAAVVTPNIPEAEILCGRSIRSFDGMRAAAQELSRLGPATVIKGGHASDAPDESVDVVFDGKSCTIFRAPRMRSRNTHGTGCTLSAGIAACLARGMPVLDAVASAKSYLTRAIASSASWRLGRGHGPVDHSVRAVAASGIRAGGEYRWENGVWMEVDA